MADEYKPEVSINNHGDEAVESQDRGKKKETEEEVTAAEFEEKVQVAESEEETFLERMKESDRRYSSSSDEEEGEDGEKEKKDADTSAQLHPEEKKGLLEKIKDKLPGHTKKPEEEQRWRRRRGYWKDKIHGLHYKTEEHKEKEMD